MPRHLLQPLPRALSGHREGPNRRRNVFQDEDVWERLDRCQVLGNSSVGHRGCVNALSWSDDGETLLSGSDDKRICIWSADPSSSSSISPHPLKLVDSIATGHRANIFSAKFLPNTSSSTIVSCAGDNGVRVFDVEKLDRAEVGIGLNARDELWGISGPGVRVLKCHTDRTKRIATENSPFLFLTVSEDGTVRQHDLRRPHICRSECPEPLFRAPRGVDLYSLSISPITPHMFAVAGRTDCAYLCDRRMLERQTPSWGPNIQSSEQVHCVRRLGMTRDQWQRDQPHGSVYLPERHITCVKMSPHRADEVICAFASHSTGIFSTYDSPGPSSIRQRSESPVVQPNNSPRRSARQVPTYNAGDFERQPSPRLGKRRQSVLSSLATNPDPPQRPRSRSIPAQDDESELRIGSPSAAQSPEAAAHPMASGDLAEEPPGESEHMAVFSEEPEMVNVTQPMSVGGGATVTIEPIAASGTSTPRVVSERMRQLLSTSIEGLDAEELADFYEEVGREVEMEGGEDEYDSDDEDEDEDDEEDDDMDLDDFGDAMDDFMPPVRSTVFDGVDMITPRRNFKGAKNMDTVKDCNFLGANSDKVCSGSDDGNFFVWDKETGRLDGIWEGDGSVVNVMEQHPTLPLLAVSGIDSTVKIFAPLAQRPNPPFTRMHLRESIVKRNLEERSFLSRGGFASVSLFDFLAQRGLRAEEDEDGQPQCPTQ